MASSYLDQDEPVSGDVGVNHRSPRVMTPADQKGPTGPLWCSGSEMRKHQSLRRNLAEFLGMYMVQIGDLYKWHGWFMHSLTSLYSIAFLCWKCHSATKNVDHNVLFGATQKFCAEIPRFRSSRAHFSTRKVWASKTGAAVTWISMFGREWPGPLQIYQGFSTSSWRSTISRR